MSRLLIREEAGVKNGKIRMLDEEATDWMLDEEVTDWMLDRDVTDWTLDEEIKD